MKARGCQHCAAECAECAGAGTLCPVCRGHRDSSGHCVDTCPSSTYNVSDAASDTERGHCWPCHGQCVDCVGGPCHSDCTICRHHKVYTADLLSHGDPSLLDDYNVTDNDAVLKVSPHGCRGVTNELSPKNGKNWS